MLRTITLRKVFLIGLLTLLIASQVSSVSAGINIWTSKGPEGGNISALVIDPTTPSTLYGWRSGGLYKSTNGGGNWETIYTGLTNTSVWSRAMVIDPTTPSTLFVGTYGDGVFKSVNGGGTWEAINNGLTSTYVIALAIDPVTPSTLYAGTSSFGSGVFKSTNGGNNWEAINNGLPYPRSFQVIAIDPANPSTIYMGSNYSNGGVFKSVNGGGNWEAVNTDLTAGFIRVLSFDPITTGTLYAGAYGGVFKSVNGGGNWEAVNTDLTNTNIQGMAIDPATPSTLYVGTYGGGVFKSVNGGGNWSAFNAGLESTYVGTLALASTIPSTLYALTNGGMFAIQQVPASLAINYSSGAPGSYFTITGSNFPPDSAATITVNGNVLGTVPTDSSGSFTFLLKTSQADEGYYGVTASVNPSASTQFTLNAEDDLHPQEGSGTVFDVPDGIAYHVVYLPLTVK